MVQGTLPFCVDVFAEFRHIKTSQTFNASYCRHPGESGVFPSQYPLRDLRYWHLKITSCLGNKPFFVAGG
jgi:hypothetical protein